MPTRNKKYIGIDIGITGGIAVIDGDVITTHAFPTIKGAPDYHAFHDLLSIYANNSFIVFEDLHALYKASAASTFTLGSISGATEMAVIGLSIPFTKVKAVVWQKELFVGIKEITKPGKKSRDTKAMALLAAKRLFPKTPLTATQRSSVPHKGIVDALLLAEYGRRRF